MSEKARPAAAKRQTSILGMLCTLAIVLPGIFHIQHGPPVNAKQAAFRIAVFASGVIGLVALKLAKRRSA